MTGPPSVESLWDRGRHQAAIGLLLERINREPPTGRRPLVLQLVSYVRQLGDHQGAARLLRPLLMAHPDDPEITALLEEVNRGQGPPPAAPAKPAEDRVLSRWSGVALPPDATNTMAAQVTGRVLNLEAAQRRWQEMKRQIERLGWTATHQRFAAQGASVEEAQRLGLRSAGELGLWRTTKRLLTEWLGSDPGAEAVLHVIEDDAILHPALPSVLAPLKSCLPKIDLLFTEAFLTRPLYERFRALEMQRQQSGQSLLFAKGGQYLACASSYLLRPNGARIVLAAMNQMEQTGKLLPIDLAYRHLIRTGNLSAAITLPFFSTVAQAGDSRIQTGLNANIALAKSADLTLRRLLYLQTWEPQSVPSVLTELAELLADHLDSDQTERLLLDMLSHGKSLGWLGHY